MNKKQIFISFLFVVFIFSYCKKEEQLKNSPPTSFTIKVLDKSYNSVIIGWEPAIDLDNDSLYYTVYLNDSVIAQDLKTTKNLKIANLKPSKNYNGRVEVTDKKSAAVSVSFSFTTLRYFLKYRNTIRFPDGYVSGYSIDKTYDGGYIVGGGINFDNTRKLLIFKTDSSGNKLWHSVYTPAPDEIRQIKQTKDHGYIAIGIRNVLKINEFGTVEWSRNEETSQNSVVLSSVVQTTDEGFLVFGSHMGKLYLLKYDNSGNKQWYKKYGAYNFESGKYIIDCNDNNYMIFGDIGPDHDHNFWVAKIDSNGNIIWENTYGDNRYDFASQIIKANDGGYILLGYSWGTSNTSEVHVIKIDNSGNKIWDKSLAQYEYQLAFSITNRTNNEYIITGFVSYTSSSDLLLIKLNNEGDLIWSKKFDIDDVNYYCVGREIKQTNDGGVIVVGDVGNPYGDHLNECGIWLLKLDSDGNCN